MHNPLLPLPSHPTFRHLVGVMIDLALKSELLHSYTVTYESLTAEFVVKSI